MKQPSKAHLNQPAMIAEYNQLLHKSCMSNKDLTEALGVRYECILGRRKGRQTITQEALLALRYVVAERDANRLVAKARALAEREEAGSVDPLADLM